MLLSRLIASVGWELEARPPQRLTDASAQRLPYPYSIKAKND
ncbi:MAG: hypothetical protein ACRDP3_19635 [Streptomyces sp.]